MSLLATTRLGLFSILALGATTTQAMTIIDNMDSAPAISPGWTYGDPWTSVIFGNTGMSSSNGVLTMSTHQYEGIWFGNGSAIGHYPNPAWNLGDSTDGNYLSMTMQLSQGAADWEFYFYDLDGYGAFINFNPAGCTNYTCSGQPGFEYWYQDTNTNQSMGTFVSMDLSTSMHTFEALLKNGQISYALDGQLLYSGVAYQSSTTNLLVIGDGTGSTGTGLGSMYIDQVIFDNAPTINALTAVPVPAATWLFGSGLLGLFGIARRKHIRV